RKPDSLFSVFGHNTAVWSVKQGREQVHHARLAWLDSMSKWRLVRKTPADARVLKRRLVPYLRNADRGCSNVAIKALDGVGVIDSAGVPTVEQPIRGLHAELGRIDDVAPDPSPLFVGNFAGVMPESEVAMNGVIQRAGRLH